MIFETIIISQDATGSPHVSPFGICHEGDFVVISPYKPSTTLDNILTTKCATMNLTDDVRVFAGSLTNHKTWGLLQANKVEGFRLADCLAYVELRLVEVREDATRPQLIMQKVFEQNHRPFAGFKDRKSVV